MTAAFFFFSDHTDVTSRIYYPPRARVSDWRQTRRLLLNKKNVRLMFFFPRRSPVEITSRMHHESFFFFVFSKWRRRRLPPPRWLPLRGGRLITLIIHRRLETVVLSCKWGGAPCCVENMTNNVNTGKHVGLDVCVCGGGVESKKAQRKLGVEEEYKWGLSTRGHQTAAALE